MSFSPRETPNPSLSPGERARYRAFIEQDAAGIAEIDLQGRFRLVNRKFCEITGYSEEELLKLSVPEITHPDDLPRNLVLLERLVKDRAPFAIEKRYVRKDGSQAWVYLSVTRIEPSFGEPPSILGVVLDLSARRSAERAAQIAIESYEALLNSIDAGFCVIQVLFDEHNRAADYVFLEMNGAFERVANFRNARGARMRHLVPTLEQYWFDTYGHVALTGESIRFEQQAAPLDRWFSVYAFRIGDPAERKVGVLFDDISARKAAERHTRFVVDLAETLAPLREEEEIVRAAVSTLGKFLDVDRCFFVECLESENRIVIGPNYARPGTPSMAGELTLFEFGGIEWWRHYSRGDFAVTDVRSDPLTRDKAAAYAPWNVVSYMVQPFKGEGAWTTVLGVTEAKPRVWSPTERKLVEDVCARVWPLVERARSERALVAAHEALEVRVADRTAKLQETVSELESYSYSISHDLRAPLRAMQSYASILATDCAQQLGADGKEYLRRIMTAAERMDRLIRDVLVFSRVTRDAMPLERIELGSFIAGVMESYPGLSVATAEIEVVSPLGAVHANPAALTQCVANLLGNATKFVRPGVKPRVRIWSEMRPPRLRLFIRDNGIGIPAEAHEKIFGMFYQLDQASEGTGVGLAVVRKAVERMGGKIGVESAPGQGSTFWLELQAAPSAISV